MCGDIALCMSHCDMLGDIALWLPHCDMLGDIVLACHIVLCLVTLCYVW